MPRIPRSSPQWYAQELERLAHVPAGSDDRFAGYAIMGQRFASGHVLALRRWPASSIGPAYTSVWHQFPDGTWRLYANVSPAHSCARYIGSVARSSWEGPIRLCWAAPYRLRVEVRGVGLEWETDFRHTWLTRAYAALCHVTPDAVLAMHSALGALDKISAAWFRNGPTGFAGVMPNAYTYRMLPRHLWPMEDARAWLHGVPLGRVQHGAQRACMGRHTVMTSGALAVATAHVASQGDWHW